MSNTTTAAALAEKAKRLEKELRQYGQGFDDGPGMFKEAADVLAALSAAQARPEEPDNWSAGAEDCDGNLLVTIRADELAALAEFAAGPGLSEYRIDGDMVRREVLSVRMQQLAADARSGAALPRPAARGWEAPPVMNPDRDDVFADPPALPALKPTFAERVERLQSAVEGECDGLSISDVQAVTILNFLDTGLPPDASRRHPLPALQEPQWISVDDQLPELGQLVLGWDSGLSVFSRDDGGGDGWLWARQSWAWNLAEPQGIECDDDYQVTHWMPLPAAPGIGSSPKEKN